MVVFVTQEYYITAYDYLRRVQRGNADARPVQVFCSVSVESVAPLCLLLHLLDADFLRYDVHPVRTQEDIRTVVGTHAVFTGAAEQPDDASTICVMLNCGAAVSIPDVLDLRRCHVHLLDAYAPIQLDTLTSSVQTLYIWDSGGVRESIEAFFTRRMRNTRRRKQQQEKKRKRRKRQRRNGQEVVEAGSSSNDEEGEDSVNEEEDDEENEEEDDEENEEEDDEENEEEDEDEDEDDDDNDEGFTWDQLLHLSPDAEDAYYRSTSMQGTDASRVWFEVARGLRPQLDDATVWYRAVALAEALLYHTTRCASPCVDVAATYVEEMVSLQHAVHLSNITKSSVRRALGAGVEEGVGDTGAEVYVSMLHDVHLEVVVEYPLLLLSHWSLWDAVHHSAVLAAHLGLYKGDCVGIDHLKDLLAHAGVTMREAQAQWYDLPLERRQRVASILASEAERVFGLRAGSMRVHSIARRSGYARPTTAMDAAHVLYTVMSEGDSARDGFLTALGMLRSEQHTLSSKGVPRALSYFRVLFLQACALVQKGVITTLRAFHYVFLSHEDVTAVCRCIPSLRILGWYIVHYLAHIKTRGRAASAGAGAGGGYGSTAKPLLIGAAYDVEGTHGNVPTAETSSSIAAPPTSVAPSPALIPYQGNANAATQVVDGQDVLHRNRNEARATPSANVSEAQWCVLYGMSPLPLRDGVRRRGRNTAAAARRRRRDGVEEEDNEMDMVGADSERTSIFPYLVRAAQAFPSQVRLNGIGKEWVIIPQRYLVAVLEHIHTDMTKPRARQHGASTGGVPEPSSS